MLSKKIKKKKKKKRASTFLKFLVLNIELWKLRVKKFNDQKDRKKAKTFT